MRAVITLVVGMALLVLGAQGAIRLLADHDNAGLLSWMPGEFAVRLVVYVVLAVAGAALAGRGGRELQRNG